ncbi:MAG: hypothetical protein IPJ34_22360 [Myxococcales bacterium]|nr:hypothetical protein [Myxococcales bacterium]
MIILPIFLFVMLVVLGLAVGFSSLGPYGRVLREKTSPIGSLTTGPAEIAGTVRADAPPLENLAGEKVVVLETVVSYSYRNPGGKGYTTSLAFEDAQVVPFSLVDASGSCRIDADGAMLLGVEASRYGAVEDMRARHPHLEKAFAFPKNAETIYVSEKYVLDGAEGFASGNAEEIGTEDVEEDYRGVRAKFQLAPGLERPLILAGHSERTVRSMLLRPALLLFAIAIWSTGAIVSLAMIWRRIGD